MTFRARSLTRRHGHCANILDGDEPPHRRSLTSLVDQLIEVLDPRSSSSLRSPKLLGPDHGRFVFHLRPYPRAWRQSKESGREPVEQGPHHAVA